MISEEELQMQHVYNLHQQNESNGEDDSSQHRDSEATKLFVGQIPKDVIITYIIVLIIVQISYLLEFYRWMKTAYFKYFLSLVPY